jgi:interferon gamma-inducible protein 30
MPRFATAQLIAVALFFTRPAEGVPLSDEELLVQSSLLASSGALADELGPFDWVKKLFGGSAPAEVHEHGPISKVAKVEIYYETLCPYCTHLFNDSVRPIFEDKELSKRVDFHLYPFGNALVLAKENISEGYQFWHKDAIYPVFKCQHGEQECLGNMIQACAIDELKKVELYLPMTICMSSYDTAFGIEKTSYECGQQLGIDMKRIKQCANSRTGSELLSEYGDASTSENLNRTYVPWVVVNGVHEEDADGGELLKPLCAVLEDPKPEMCKDVLGKKAKLAGCGDKGHGC